MDVSHLLDALNPAQREAVSAAPGHYLVLAGIFLGDRIHTGMSEQVFRRTVCAILILSGIPLMLK